MKRRLVVQIVAGDDRSSYLFADELRDIAVRIEEGFSSGFTAGPGWWELEELE